MFAKITSKNTIEEAPYYKGSVINYNSENNKEQLNNDGYYEVVEDNNVEGLTIPLPSYEFRDNKIYMSYIEGSENVIIEPTQEDIESARILELQSFLDNTDWYSSRYVEQGVAIPENIKQQRQAAREEISTLRGDEAIN